MIVSLKNIFFTIVLVCSIQLSYSTAQTMEYSQNPHYFRAEEMEGLLKRAGSLKHNNEPGILEQQRKFDVQYYNLNISVDPLSQSINGILGITAKSVINDLERILLDLSGNLTVTAVTGTDIDTFFHESDLIDIALTTPLSAGELTSITVEYEGKPRPEGLGSFIFGNRGNGEPLIWTLSQPFFAHTWWPCKDLPEDKADSVDVVITVPDGLTAVSNGVLRQTVENPDGTKTFFWHEGYPVPPYLVSLAVSGYDVRKDIFTTAGGDTMPVEFYVTPEKSGAVFGPGSAFPQTLDMLRVFSELFGNYPFLNEKYAQVEFGAGGGMEHQTATSLNVPPAGPNVFLVSHELAHQWWGDFITCRDWHHIWLNEGFATYSEGIYLESLGGKPALKDFIGSITAPPGEWGSVFRDNIDDVDDILTGVVFEKGAWVLHMLRSVVGDALFFEILRALWF